jgi:hypothetical protein
MFTLSEGSFPKKEMEKNQERLTNTVKHIFGKIVTNLLIPEDKTANPYELTAQEIESNETKQNKTITILRCGGALPIQRTEVGQSWSRYEKKYYNFEHLFKEYAQEYTEVLEFPEIPEELKDHMESNTITHFSTKKDKLDEYGYVTLKHIRNGQKIYVYYHQDLYHVIEKDKRDYFKIYPKTMLESRTKAVIKALMRLYCEEDMLTYLKRKFDIDFSGQEIKRDEYDDDFKISLRNFSRYPTTFNKHCFSEAGKSYAKEYAKNVAKMNFEYERLKSLSDKMNAIGGCKSVLEEYIKESVSNLVSKAPLLINGEDDDRDALEYLLDHRELITWDYLYN